MAPPIEVPRSTAVSMAGSVKGGAGEQKKKGRGDQSVS